MDPSTPSGPRLVSVGEVMVELAPAGGGLFRMGFSGDTFNAAWYARRRLPPEAAVSYLTAVGTDAVSDRLLAFLESEGLDASLVARRPDRTLGLYLIELHDGERSFSYWRGQSAARTLHRDLHRLPALGPGDALLASGITLAILPPEGREALTAALSRARDAGALVAFDPNIRPRLWESPEAARTAIARAAGAATLLLPSLDDERATFGDADAGETAARYLALGARLVMVKDGAGPVTLAGEAQGTVAPEPVPRVVDSTAAGDSFDGGAIAALMQGATPEEAAREGCRLAARVVQARGALVP